MTKENTEEQNGDAKVTDKKTQRRSEEMGAGSLSKTIKTYRLRVRRIYNIYPRIFWGEIVVSWLPLLEMGTETRVQILGDAVYISHCTNTLENGMNPTSL